MKVTDEMIHPEYRRIGKFMKVLFKPNEKSFQRLLKQEKRLIGKNIKGYECSELWVDSRETNRKIRTRIYKRINQDDHVPGVLYCHGGGYVMNVPESDHDTIKMLLEASPSVIVAPDYRLSSEAPYPAALEDAYDIYQWMVNHSEDLGINSHQIFTVGISAGGGLVTGLNLLLRDRKAHRVAFQMPLYPMLDDRCITESMKDNDAPVWSEAHNLLAWELYLKNTEGETPIYASPSRCGDLSNLPPASTFVGSLDPFRDEVVDYFDKLKATGVDVNIEVYEGVYHAFELINAKADLSKEARKYIKACFKYACEHYYND